MSPTLSSLCWSLNRKLRIFTKHCGRGKLCLKLNLQLSLQKFWTYPILNQRQAFWGFYLGFPLEYKCYFWRMLNTHNDWGQNQIIRRIKREAEL